MDIYIYFMLALGFLKKELVFPNKVSSKSEKFLKVLDELTFSDKKYFVQFYYHAASLYRFPGLNSSTICEIPYVPFFQSLETGISITIIIYCYIIFKDILFFLESCYIMVLSRHKIPNQNFSSDVRKRFNMKNQVSKAHSQDHSVRTMSYLIRKLSKGKKNRCLQSPEKNAKIQAVDSVYTYCYQQFFAGHISTFTSLS